MFQFESTIKGGLPVLVEFTIAPPEPDVGIFHDTVEDLTVKWLSGHKIKFDISDRDMDRLIDEAYDHARYEKEMAYEENEMRKCVRRYGYEKCADVW